MKRSIVRWFDRRRRSDEPLVVLPAPLPLERARRVLVLAPHPDDESIGCGGLIATLTAARVPVKAVLVSDGSGAGGLPEGAAALRQQEFRQALATLGVVEHALLGFPDGELAAGDALTQAVIGQVRAFEPNWLLAPSSADAHRDHRAVAEAARHAAQRVPSVEWLIEYETWSPLPASHLLEITAQIETKFAAIRQHVTALACGNYLSATRGLAEYRALGLGQAKPGAACEAYLVLDRGGGFAWPRGLGRPA